jgi:prepilin-type N-terminal cleavage/methylation domain-containing protein
MNPRIIGRAGGGPGWRRGLTLVELMVTTGVIGILAVAIGSTILVAARALPQRSSPARGASEAAEAVQRLVAELQYARQIVDRSATSVEFTVADCDGDEQPETIRYAWAGISGQPLTRQFNGGTPETLLGDVRELALSFQDELLSEQVPTENESAETLLANHQAGWDLDGRRITETDWYGVYFKPSLPDEATGWRVTRVSFFAKRAGSEEEDGDGDGDGDGADGEARVQLQLATAGGLPSGAVLAEKTLLEDTLSGYEYLLQEFTFTEAGGLSPQQGVCLVVRHASGAEACKVLVHEQGAWGSSPRLVRTTNGGLTWSQPGDEWLLFGAYGTVTTAGEPEIHSTYRVRQVDLSVRAQHADAPVIHAGVEPLNAPEVTAP